jgi:hypothetical protein
MICPNGATDTTVKNVTENGLDLNHAENWHGSKSSRFG